MCSHSDPQDSPNESIADIDNQAMKFNLVGLLSSRFKHNTTKTHEDESKTRPSTASLDCREAAVRRQLKQARDIPFHAAI
jgi:hypothetical protein